MPIEPLRPNQENKILVVDDEVSNREIISQFLKMEGFQVITAMDGIEALEKLYNESPDLVLLDLILPKLDGYEVCRRIKSNSETVFLPVVMITALKGAEERIKGVQVGADDFLTKPFNYLELVTRVKSLLRVKQLSDQLKNYNRRLERTVAARTAQLRTALDELRELDRLKSEFIANVSHELRTPLLHVKGYVALMVDGTLGPLTDDQRTGMETTRDAVDRLERLVEDIVDFGGVEVGNLSFEAVPVLDSIRVTMAILQRKIECFSGHVIVEAASDLPKVRADRQALTRILRHLLDNAIKFSPNGGCVTVRAMLVPQNTGVRFEVQDQGIGVPAEKQARVFDTFYQVDGSATRRFSGTGIGLALVHRLIEAHGSQIKIRSEAGQGSTFWFDLPLG